MLAIGAEVVEACCERMGGSDWGKPSANKPPSLVAQVAY
jgi:hypothetical protein